MAGQSPWLGCFDAMVNHAMALRVPATGWPACAGDEERPQKAMGQVTDLLK